MDSRDILKLEFKRIPDGIDVRYRGRNRSQDDAYLISVLNEWKENQAGLA